MRFEGEREVGAPATLLWRMLHDGAVLRRVVPGCTEMRALHAGSYAAILQARVGPVADTYRGTFTIEDLRPGAELEVQVAARGRCGRLDVALRVALFPGGMPRSTALRYAADASVGGLASRLGAGALAVAGHHFTRGFFDDLERAAGNGHRRQRTISALSPAGTSSPTTG